MVLTQMLPAPCSLLLRAWLGKYCLMYEWGYCLRLYLVKGTNGIENNGIMRDHDVIRCESDCAIVQKKNFFQNFGSKSSVADHVVARSTKF